MHDMHVHTHYSKDSKEKIAAHIDRAWTIGVKTICFTEHVDNNSNGNSRGYYNSVAFFEDFNNAKAAIFDVDLLAGVEFDCPHRYRRELSEISSLPYDCIIGSVHHCDLSPDVFFSELIKRGVPAKECFPAYWNEVLKCVKAGGFDVLGHIDVPKRYYKVLLYNETLLREIFRVMLSNGIILEINTSSLRNGLEDTMPGPAILELYCAQGGKFVTIGSDAHSAKSLAADNAVARGLAKRMGLREVIFSQRKMIDVDVTDQEVAINTI